MKNSSKPTAKKNRGRQKTDLQPVKTSKPGRVSAPISKSPKAAQAQAGNLKKEMVLRENEIRYRTKAEEALETSHSLLEAAIDSTADGLLIVDLKGKISQFNRKFVELWHIPQEILATGEDEKAIAFVLDQLKDPTAFLSKVKELYSHPQAESFDNLEFKDGRIFERYSQPHRLGEKIVGRVWSFRDVTARKRAEEALSKSEAELRALVEQVPAIIYTESADQPGKTIYISPQIEAITGYTPAEWMGSPNFWDEIVHPEDREYLDAEDARTNLTGEPFRAEYRIYTRDRSVLWILDEAVLICDDAGRALFWQGVMHDISDKKLAEKAQQESQARFTTIFNTSPISISITRLKDGRLIEVNPAFQEMYGFTRSEVVGHTLSELKICLTMDECELMMKTLINGGQVRNFETKFRRKSGEIGDLLTSADLIDLAGERYMISVQQDITDRKRTEDALSKSEAEMRALFTAMPDLVMVIDKDGRYTSIAPTAHNLLYRPPDELIGKTIADVFPQEQAAEFLGSIRTALKENRTVHLEYSLAIEGKIVWFSASISPMTEELVVWIARDITERKQADEMIARSAEELKQAQSFAHVGSFAWDLKAGRLEFSDELNRIFGFKKKSAPDLTVNALIKTIHPDDQNVVEDIFASIARDEKPAPHEFRILWPDGSVHLILVETGEFNLDEAGKPAMIKGIAQDITERRRAEEALLQSEELFRTAFRTSPDSININRLEDGLYVDINEGFTSMTGYTREETLGRTSAVINIWYDLADRRRLVEGLQKDGEVNNLEAKFRMKDGWVLTGLMSAKVILLKGVPHILSITRNIEEIKRAEMALRESNKELARLYRASAALISGAFLNTGEQAQKIVEVVQQEFG
jgi:two-component system sensor histidine kinase/response regulator